MRRGHLPHRRAADGRRDPQGDGGERLRPARLRAVRLRRRGPGARRRVRARARRAEDRHSSAKGGLDLVRLRRRRGRRAAHLRAQRDHADAGAGAADQRRARGAARTKAAAADDGGRHRRRAASASSSRSTCATAARSTRSRCCCRGRVPALRSALRKLFVARYEKLYGAARRSPARSSRSWLPAARAGADAAAEAGTGSGSARIAEARAQAALHLLAVCGKPRCSTAKAGSGNLSGARDRRDPTPRSWSIPGGLRVDALGNFEITFTGTDPAPSNRTVQEALRPDRVTTAPPASSRSAAHAVAQKKAATSCARSAPRQARQAGEVAEKKRR